MTVYIDKKCLGYRTNVLGYRTNVLGYRTNVLGYQTILLMECFVTFHHETGKGGKVKGGSFCILEKALR